MRTRFGKPADGHGPLSGVSDTVDLLRRYVLQETLAPLRHLGRMLAYGVCGAVLLGTGLVIVLVGVLRVLEGETGRTFAGSWSFAPYLLTTVIALVVMAGCALVGLRGFSNHRKNS